MQIYPQYTQQQVIKQRGRLSCLLLGLMSLLLSACNDQAKSPLEVSQAFWSAVQEKKVDDLHKYIVAGSFEGEIKADNLLSVSQINFGKILIDGHQAKVETEVTIDSDQPTMVPVNTILIKEDERWKVDYQKTIDAVTMPGEMTLFLRELKTLGKKFSEEWNHSMKELDQAMPEIEEEISEMSEQIKQRVPELKQRFDEMAEQIRKSLEESFQEDPPAGEQQEKKEDKSKQNDTTEDEHSYSI